MLLVNPTGIRTPIEFQCGSLIVTFSARLPTTEQLQQLEEQFSPDAHINFENLCHMIAAFDAMVNKFFPVLCFDPHQVPPEPDASIREAFNVFDYNGDGFIHSKDLFHIITRIGGQNKLSRYGNSSRKSF